MILPKLKGGLGNQMFQIAAAYGSAAFYEDEMSIDLNITHHSGQGHPHKKYDDNLYKNIPRFSLKGEEFDMYNEESFAYNPIYKPDVDRHLLIDGYFQSEKYFNFCDDGVRKLFYIPDDIKQGVQDKIDKIKNHFDRDEAVCIHVRRGEYLKLPNVHPVQTKDFFLKSMEQFDSNKVVYIIISNSSFGWWGAWLNTKDNNVIAPEKWFGPEGPQETKDVYCKDWIKL